MPSEKAKIGIGHWHENILFTDRAEFDVEEYVNKAVQPEEFDLRTKLEEWKENGLVIFEGCVDHKLVDGYLSDILYLDRHRTNFDLEMEFRGKRLWLRDMKDSPLSDPGVKFNCVENISLAARHLSLTKIVCRFLNHVFQDAPAVLQSLTFWRGSEQSAHLDYPYVRTQTRLPHLAASWIPLEDIHRDAGPLAYYPGSHRHGVIGPFDWGNGSIVMEPDSHKTPSEFSVYLYEAIETLGLRRETFLPKRGDVLVWHGNLLHEGTRVNDTSRTRRSYVTHYTSLEAYPRHFMMPNALQIGAYTTLHGGYVFDHPWVRDDKHLPSWKTLL